MNNKKQILLIFFTGLIAALFLLEIGLRIVGGIFRDELIPDKIYISGKEDKQYRILCLGNSFTVGTGAPAGQSYPSQLQRLFNKETKRKKVRVINAGVGNQNSTELLSRLKYNIVNLDPDMVIIQTGQPNFWNQYKYKMYLDRKHSTNTFFKKSIFYLNDFLYCSRIYRLSLLLAYKIKERGVSRNLPVTKHTPYYLETAKWLRQLETGYKIEPSDQGKVEKAMTLFKREVEASPGEVNNYRFIGDICFYQKKYKEAAEWFIRGIKADPGYIREGEGNKNYFLLRMVYRYSGDKEAKEIIDEFINGFKRTNSEYSENFLFLKKQEICDWIESDIKEIIRIAKNEGIKVILQNYPCAINKENVIYFNNIILPKIAEDSNVSFVDNNRVFQEMLDRGAKREDLFESSSGGHCNAKGYGVMAMNIFNKIKEEKMIDLDE